MDEALLQEGFAIISNSSVAFFKQRRQNHQKQSKHVRLPRSVDFEIIPAPCDRYVFSDSTLTPLVLPILVLFFLIVTFIRLRLLK